MQLNIVNRGQVFTPYSIARRMLKLHKNKSSVLEPSAGTGVFLAQLEKDAVGIEIEQRIIKDQRIISCDFFDYPDKNKFDTIIGNPPYVRYQDIEEKTKNILPMDLFDKRTNLYLFLLPNALSI